MRLHTDCGPLADAGAELLRHFHADPEPEEVGCQMLLHRVAETHQIPHLGSERSEVLVQQGPAAGGEGPAVWTCTVSRDNGRTQIELPHGALSCDGPRGRVEGWVVAPERMSADEREGFVFIALTELLRHQGLYGIHAAGLERAGRGILVPGPSGQGKTTCLLALLGSGWSCLSDDHTLFRDEGTGPELLPFPARIEITPETAARFPALPQQALRPGPRKLALYPEQLGGRGIGAPCRAALLLFPHVIDSAHSSMERFPRHRALEEVMRASLLVFDRDVASRQFHALARLVEEAACYRLHFGADVDCLGELVDATLEPLA